MKKHLLVVVVVLLIASLTCMFTACNSKGGEESLPYDSDQVQANLLEIAKTGYEINFEFSTSDGEESASGTYTIGAKDNVVWAYATVGEDVGGYAIKTVDDIEIFYNYENSSFEYSGQITEDNTTYENNFKTDYLEWLLFGQDLSGSLSKADDTQVAGRDCYQYEYKPLDSVGFVGTLISKFADVNINYVLAIDKETGMTMKVTANVEAEEDTTAFNYEVKSFKTESQVVIPNLPEPTEN